MKEELNINEIFEKIKTLNIDEAVYYNYESNKQEKEVQIRCNNGYARINIRPDETKITVYEDEIFTVNNTSFRDLGKNRYCLVLNKALSIKKIEKYLNKPVWYNGVFRKIKKGA